MNEIKNKLLEKCLKHFIDNQDIRTNNISTIKKLFDSISISKKQNFKVLTNWDLASINRENLYLKLGINIDILNNDKMNYKKFYELIKDEDSFCFTHMVEFVPHYIGDLLNRKKTFFNSSDIDLQLPSFFSDIFYKNTSLSKDFFITCLGFDEADKFKKIYDQNAFVNPFLFTGLTFLRWYDFFLNNHIIFENNINNKDIYFTGNIFNTVLGNKLDFLLKNCAKLDEFDYNIKFIDSHLPAIKYYKLLQLSKFTLCHCRFKDSILTRAIDAYIFGSVPILNEASLTNYFFKQNSFITYKEFENCSSKIDFKKLIDKRKYRPSINEILNNAISNIKIGIKLELFYKEYYKNNHAKQYSLEIKKSSWAGEQKLLYTNKKNENIYLFAGRKLAIPNTLNIKINEFSSEKSLLERYPIIKISDDLSLKINRTAFTNTLKDYAFERIYEIYNETHSVRKNIIDLSLEYLNDNKNKAKTLILNEYLTTNLFFAINNTITQINLSFNQIKNCYNLNERKELSKKLKIDILFLKLNSLFRISLYSSNQIKSYDLLPLIDKSILALESINFDDEFKDNIMRDSKYFLPFDFSSNTFNNHLFIKSIIKKDSSIYKKTLLSSFQILRFCLTGIKSDLYISLETFKDIYAINLINLLNMEYLDSENIINKNCNHQNQNKKNYKSVLKKIFNDKLNKGESIPNLISKNARFLFI